MVEQKKRNSLHPFFKVFIVICDLCVMSCSDSSPGIRNTGTVRPMIHLAHVFAFDTHTLTTYTRTTWFLFLNLVVADFFWCPLILWLEETITTCFPSLYQYDFICLFRFFSDISYLLPFLGWRVLLYSVILFTGAILDLWSSLLPFFEPFRYYYILFRMAEYQDCVQYSKYWLGGHMILYSA